MIFPLQGAKVFIFEHICMFLYKTYYVFFKEIRQAGIFRSCNQ
jgi:hypothetical protein